MTSYLTLFAASFAAATVLPMQSEAVLSGMLVADAGVPWMLVAVASAGNVLGAVVNWLLGWEIERFRDRKWFPVKPETLERAKRWYGRYGLWTLLLSWAPFIGDAFTVVAGVMKVRLPVFVAIVGIAKTARYVILALVVLKLI